MSTTKPAYDEVQHPRDPRGRWTTKPASESRLELDGGESSLATPATPTEVTDEHLREAMASYLGSSNDVRNFDEWAEELDYEDDDFGDIIWQATQAMQNAGLPGTHSAVCTPDSSEYGASVDIGVYDEVNGRHCTRFANQYEFWNESGEPSDRAAHLLRRTYESIAGEQGTLDAQRERDTRLATMQRSMTWQILPPNNNGIKRDVLKAAYPGLTDDEALIGFARLTDARDEIERHKALTDLQTTSDERTMKQEQGVGRDAERDRMMTDSRQAFSRAMSDSGIYRRSVARFVGANLNEADIEKLSESEDLDDDSYRFWSRARRATGRAPY